MDIITLLSFDFSFHPIGIENVFYRALLKRISCLEGVKIKDKAYDDMKYTKEHLTKQRSR